MATEYESLKADRDAQQKRADALEVRLRNALSSAQEAIQRAHAANQTADALAVENAALKSRSIKLFNLGYLRGHESTVEGYFVDVHWCDIDTYHDDVVAEIIEDEDGTPSTSAALAAIQAQGVEKARAVVSSCRENICPGGLSENRQYEESIVKPHLDGITDELGNLIIELRGD